MLSTMITLGVVVPSLSASLLLSEEFGRTAVLLAIASDKPSETLLKAEAKAALPPAVVRREFSRFEGFALVQSEALMNRYSEDLIASLLADDALHGFAIPSNPREFSIALHQSEHSGFTRFVMIPSGDGAELEVTSIVAERRLAVPEASSLVSLGVLGLLTALFLRRRR